MVSQHTGWVNWTLLDGTEVSEPDSGEKWKDYIKVTTLNVIRSEKY